jgi:acyl carrier protein
VITTDHIRRILVDGRTLAGVEDLGDDTEILIDSFSLAWLRHSLRTEFDVELDLHEVRAEDFASINRITHYVNALAARTVAQPGENR